MTLLIYTGIAIGCHQAGWGFWRGMFWPVSLGRSLAEMADVLTPEDRDGQEGGRDG